MNVKNLIWKKVRQNLKNLNGPLGLRSGIFTSSRASKRQGPFHHGQMPFATRSFMLELSSPDIGRNCRSAHHEQNNKVCSSKELCRSLRPQHTCTSVWHCEGAATTSMSTFIMKFKILSRVRIQEEYRGFQKRENMRSPFFVLYPHDFKKGTSFCSISSNLATNEQFLKWKAQPSELSLQLR